MIVEDTLETLKNPGTERLVLSCAWRSPDAWMTAQDFIKADDFSTPVNRAIWTVVDSLRAQGVNIDPVVVTRELPESYRGELEGKLGGWAYLDSLNDMPVDPKNIMHYAHELRELLTKRRMVHTADAIREMVLSKPKASADKLLNDIELAVNEIPGVTEAEIVDLGSIGLDFVKDKMSHVKEIPGYETGFPVFDQYISGASEGDLVVFAGAPGAGKSTVLLNIAQKFAIQDGIPIGWIATEHMPDEEYSRLLSMTSGVNEKSIGNGTFSAIPEWLERVSAAEEKLNNHNFHFLSLPKFRFEQVERYVNKMVRQHGIKALFFDYIRIPESGKGDVFWQEVGEFAYGLKALAAKHKIPVLSAVQINRKGREAVRYGEDLSVDFFANSDDIGRAISVGVAIRELSKKELEELTVDRDHSRIVEIVKNRHGSKGYRYEYLFHAETLKLIENAPLE